MELTNILFSIIGFLIGLAAIYPLLQKQINLLNAQVADRMNSFDVRLTRSEKDVEKLGESIGHVDRHYSRLAESTSELQKQMTELLRQNGTFIEKLFMQST